MQRQNERRKRTKAERRARYEEGQRKNREGVRELAGVLHRAANKLSLEAELAGKNSRHRPTIQFARSQ
jgi:hypothetical protein